MARIFQDSDRPTSSPKAAERAPVRLTQAAADRIAALLRDEQEPDLKLRIVVRGGGCAGFDYHFAFEHEVHADDLTLVQHGITLVADAHSYQQLLGAQIDFLDDANGAGFAIDNPNAPTSCACAGGTPCESQMPEGVESAHA